MDMRKKIAWITADGFIDVDIAIVPALAKYYDIDWYIIKEYNSKIEIPEVTSIKQNIIQSPYKRARDFRKIFFFRNLIAKAKKNKPDFFYIDYLGLPFFYFVLDSMVKSNKIIHAAHNVIPYEGWPNRRMTTFYVNYIFKKHTHFHIFSSFLLDYFKNKFPGKNPFYAPLGLKDYGEPTIGQPDYDKIGFLFFGNVRTNKRLDVLVEAFKKLPPQIKEKTFLTIAGQCSELERYTKMIGDEPNIIADFRRIPDSEVPNLFLKHHYLVLPYENVAQSGPHMVAYNYNVPVICSDIDGFKERVADEKNGFLFKVNDSDDLANTLKKAAGLSSENYNDFKEDLEKFVFSNYTFDAILGKYKEFFDSL